MTSYPCPHCGKPTVSLWRRLCLGPARPTACTACGSDVGVPWSSLWLIVIYVVARGVVRIVLDVTGITASLTMPSMVALESALLGLALAAWIRWVPLVRR